MPDSTGNFKGVFIPHVPWHLAKENTNLSKHWFCEGEACERDCHCPKTVAAFSEAAKRANEGVDPRPFMAPEAICDESKCSKPCRKCDRDGIAEKGEW